MQRRPNVFDVGPALYKCYTNVLCSLGFPIRDQAVVTFKVSLFCILISNATHDLDLSAVVAIYIHLFVFDLAYLMLKFFQVGYELFTPFRYMNNGTIIIRMPFSNSHSPVF